MVALVSGRARISRELGRFAVCDCAKSWVESGCPPVPPEERGNRQRRGDNDVSSRCAMHRSGSRAARLGRVCTRTVKCPFHASPAFGIRQPLSRVSRHSTSHVRQPSPASARFKAFAGMRRDRVYLVCTEGDGRMERKEKEIPHPNPSPRCLVSRRCTKKVEPEQQAGHSVLPYLRQFNARRFMPRSPCLAPKRIATRSNIKTWRLHDRFDTCT